MARNKSEKVPHREVLLAYVNACVAFLDEPNGSHKDTLGCQARDAWGRIPLAVQDDIRGGDLPFRERRMTRPDKMAYIFSTFGVQPKAS